MDVRARLFLHGLDLAHAFLRFALSLRTVGVRTYVGAAGHAFL